MSSNEKMMKELEGLVISQVALPEENEVTINIDYYGGEIWVYSNVATVMRRMLKAGHIPVDIQYVPYVENDKRVVFSMDFRLPISQLGSFVRTGLFKRG